MWHKYSSYKHIQKVMMRTSQTYKWLRHLALQIIIDCIVFLCWFITYNLTHFIKAENAHSVKQWQNYISKITCNSIYKNNQCGWYIHKIIMNWIVLQFTPSNSKFCVSIMINILSTLFINAPNKKPITNHISVEVLSMNFIYCQCYVFTYKWNHNCHIEPVC